MSNPKTITLRAKYESDLSGLKSDLAAIKSFRRNLEKQPLKIPVRLDLSGVRGEAHKAAAEIKKAVTGAMSTIRVGGATSKGGILIPASAMKEMEAFAATGKGAFKEVRAENGKLIQSYEQLAAGIQRVTTIGKKGKTVKLVDTRPLEAFQQKLAEIERKWAGRIGSTKGSGGDVAAVLRMKQAEISAALADPKLNEAIKNHPIYQRADRSMNRLEERIQSISGTQIKQSERAMRARRIDQLKDRLVEIDKNTAIGIGRARGSQTGISAALENKRRQIEAELTKFADIANSPAYRSAQKSINSLGSGSVQAHEVKTRRDAKEAERTARKAAAAKKADHMRRTDSYIARQDHQINRVQTKYLKAQESIAKQNLGQADREAALNRVLDARAQLLERQITQYQRLAAVSKGRGYGQAASRYTNAAYRMQGELNQIRLDQQRTDTGRIRSAADYSLNRELARVKNEYNRRLEELRNQESAARNTLSGKAKQSALQSVERGRMHARNEALTGMHQVWREAGRRGDTGLKQRAENSMAGLEKQGVASMRRMESATRSSGHALNFHTSSLLKNAATFAKWYIPAQAAMGVFSALSGGIQGAVNVQRTFKVLEAVFRGSTEEAKLLADQTLILAAANGRSTQEAAEASVAWARMGLTRTQILVAMETSLRAANVAEISAAESTAYLTANYKAFGQTIAEIPATLDYINSLSNKNAVAPKEIFEGLSRSAVIAKEAGITFQELAAIIATVSAETQRPGAEIGNAVKSLSTRLRRPATVKKLKEEFGYDVTTGTGDAKQMTQILGELAALYPTLNRLEKGRLEDMVAGAHQGNRFAVVMNNWTEILGAQADAGLDANSAMRENAKIIDSVSAKLESLGTTWTRFMHTLGEAGAFDFIGARLEDLGHFIQVYQGLLGGGSAKGSGKGSGRQKLTILEEFIGGVGVIGDRAGEFFAGGKYRNGNSMSDAEYLEAARSYADSSVVGSFGRSIIAKLSASNKSAIDRTTSATMAEEVTGLRGRAEGLSAMSGYFKALSKSYGADGFSKDKQLEGFDKRMAALSTAKDLPGGAALAASARKDIRPLLAAGNIEAARDALAAYSEQVKALAENESATLSSKLPQYIQQTESALTAANNEITSLNSNLETADGKTQENLQQQLAATTDNVKALSDNLATLRKEFELPANNPYTDEMKERMTRFIAETKMAATVYGSLLDSFGGTGFANLDATLAAGSAAMNRNMLQQVDAATAAENAIKDAQDQETLNRLSTVSPAGLAARDIAAITDEKSRRDQSLSAVQNELSKITEETDAALREIEMKRQAATVKMGYDDGRRFTAAGFSRFETGVNEGEKLTSRGFGILSQIQGSIENPALGGGNAVQDARELGSLTERMTQAKETYFSMEDRINRALAERVNLEHDIAEETRKQNEEASKRLAMASREDQLRSAAAAAVLRGRGQKQFSMEEFQFFSDGTRNAIQSFNPGSVKGLDDLETSANERRSKLDEETRGLAISIRAFRDALETILPKAEEKAGSIVDVNNPMGTKAPTASAVTDLNKNEIRMNLNTGPITVNLDFGRHVQDIKTALQTHLDAKLDALRAEYRRFRMDLDPNTSAAAGAF